jgi:Sulfatase
MRKILNTDFHFIAIILFFILHGINEFGNSLPFWDTALYTAVLILASAIVYYLYVLKFKNKTKAGVFVSGLLVVFLFFGSFQDFLSANKYTASLASMETSVMIAGVGLLLFLFWLKAKKEISASFIRYVNLLFLLFITIEIIIVPLLFLKSGNELKLSENKAELKTCDTCSKPPVYLVILDGYAGKYTLQKHFQYNNENFYTQLSAKGFYVADSSFSNYRITVFSMASLLNMGYLNNAGPFDESNSFLFRKSIKSIENNTITKFFLQAGYRINNYSQFDLPKSPATTRNEFWGGNLRLLTSQTMYNRVMKYLPFLLSRYKITNWARKKINNGIWEHTHNALEKTITEAKQQNNQQPHFTYVHLNIPHDPYLCDSIGNRIDITVAKNYTPLEKQDAYLQYLVYANKIILNWVNEIQAVTKGKAVIMIMSDHGVRPLAYKDQWTRRVDNLNAIYLPAKDYSKWYKGVSNVNQFRLLLNELFHQNLPLLPDKDF